MIWGWVQWDSGFQVKMLGTQLFEELQWDFLLP